MDVLNHIQNKSGFKKMNKNAIFKLTVLILLYAKMTQHSCFPIFPAALDLHCYTDSLILKGEHHQNG